MYILFKFNGESLIARDYTFKAHYESKGAKVIKRSYDFSELARLTDES